MKIQGKISTRNQLLLHRFPLHLGKTNTTSVLTLDFSIFLLLLGCPSSVQHMERNQHKNIFLPSSAWSLEHIDCVSNKFGNVLFPEQCDHLEVSLHLGRYRMVSKVWRRLLVELCHSHFLRELFHSQIKMRLPRNSVVKYALLFNCAE